jgi:hypothetical protein
MHTELVLDRALAGYFREKQYAMGQRFDRSRIVSALARRGLPAGEVDELVDDWQGRGLIRAHPDHTISLTAAAYPRLTG